VRALIDPGPLERAGRPGGAPHRVLGMPGWGLTKRYGAKVAVDDLTFGVEPGKVTGFL